MPLPPLSVWRPLGASWAVALCLTHLAVCAQTPAPAEQPLIPWRASLDSGAGVQTQVVQPQAPAAALLLQGTVVLPAQQGDVVSLPVAGVVQAVLVAPMQQVRAGQPVARVLSPELAQWQRDWWLAQTQARLAQDKARRDEQLFADGIIAEVRRNESRAQAEMAALVASERRQALRLAGVGEAALNAGQASLSPQLTLVAPVAGTVLEQLATPGQRLEAGQPVAHIARGGRLAIEVQAAREQARSLRVGDVLSVEGCQVTARITALSPQLSSTNQAVQLRAEPQGQDNCLSIGQFVQLRWQGAASAAVLSVPGAAVAQHAGRHYVFVREAGGFRPVAVNLGAGGGESVTVTSGLQPGQVVAVRGVAAIKGAWLGLGSQGKAP